MINNLASSSKYRIYRYVHEWQNDNNFLIFHTIPMIHIGTHQYYLHITKLIEHFNHLLIEGVKLNRLVNFGNYKAIAEAIGWVTQSNMLKFPNDIKIINIDIKPNLFSQFYKHLPILDKIKLFLLSIFIKWIKLFKIDYIENIILKSLAYPNNYKYHLINPENHIPFRHNRKHEYELLIANKRDKEIQTHLQKYINDNNDRQYRLDIGILFGDGHMPYIYDILLKNKYHWKLEDTIYFNN